MHTIAWVVTASNGQVDGIGSRYFTIVNGSSLTLAGQPGALAGPAVLNAGADFGRPARIDARSGRRLVLAHELERVVVDASSAGAGSYEAYRVVNGRLDALPIGASFDRSRGVLYWQPSVGYVGDYDFVIVNGKKERTQVRVVLQPQRPSRTARTWSFDLCAGVVAAGFQDPPRQGVSRSPAPIYPESPAAQSEGSQRRHSQAQDRQHQTPARARGRERERHLVRPGRHEHRHVVAVRPMDLHGPARDHGLPSSVKALRDDQELRSRRVGLDHEIARPLVNDVARGPARLPCLPAANRGARCARCRSCRCPRGRRR